MFPIPFNFPFRKNDGSLVPIGEAMSGGGGGGDTFHTVLFYNSDGSELLDREYVKDGDDALFSYMFNEWSTTIDGEPVEGITEDITSDLTLYYVGDVALHIWDFTKSVKDTVTGTPATLSSGINRTSDGVKISAASQFVNFNSDIFPENTTIEIEFGAVEFKGLTNQHETMLTIDNNSNGGKGLIFKSSDNYWAFYSSSWSAAISSDWSGADKRNVFANKKLGLYKDSSNYINVYLDGVLIKGNAIIISDRYIYLGNAREASSGGQCYDATFKKVCVFYGNHYAS